jgi:hypothetical protein
MAVPAQSFVGMLFSKCMETLAHPNRGSLETVHAEGILPIQRVIGIVILWENLCAHSRSR